MIRRQDSIPVLLLTGFLGSGKTSLLNHLLKNKQGLKIGVLVNDFGDLNIDASLVSAQSEQTLELSNGCICCAIADEDLDDALSQLAYRGSSLDYIIIEASGVANPAELASLIRLSPNRYSHFDTLVVLVDGANFAENNQKSPQAAESLAVADLVVINKTDLIGPKELTETKKAVKLAAPKARILTSQHGRVDWRLFLQKKTTANSEVISESNKPKEEAKPATDHGHDHDHDHDHYHDHGHDPHPEFSSLSFASSKPLDPKLFEEWMKNLDQTIFRAKGIIFFGIKGADQKFIFQAVGSRAELKLDEWRINEKPKTQILLIGLGFEKEEKTKELEGLVDKNPDNITAETLMDIFRYK